MRERLENLRSELREAKKLLLQRERLENEDSKSRG